MKEKKIIIGFMGSGKTTIGNALSQKYSLRWVDLDQEIEKVEGKPISEIFKENGEDYFRQKEHEVLQIFLQKPYKMIISTGGGIVERENNLELLIHQDTVFLQWDFDTLYQRVAKDPARPLAKTYEQLHTLYEKRLPRYKKIAKKVIECDNLTIQQIIDKIGE
jgi:shikimate kinase